MATQKQYTFITTSGKKRKYNEIFSVPRTYNGIPFQILFEINTAEVLVLL